MDADLSWSGFQSLNLGQHHDESRRRKNAARCQPPWRVFSPRPPRTRSSNPQPLVPRRCQRRSQPPSSWLVLPRAEALAPTLSSSFDLASIRARRTSLTSPERLAGFTPSKLKIIAARQKPVNEAWTGSAERMLSGAARRGSAIAPGARFCEENQPSEGHYCSVDCHDPFFCAVLGCSFLLLAAEEKELLEAGPDHDLRRLADDRGWICPRHSVRRHQVRLCESGQTPRTRDMLRPTARCRAVTVVVLQNLAQDHQAWVCSLIASGASRLRILLFAA